MAGQTRPFTISCNSLRIRRWLAICLTGRPALGFAPILEDALMRLRLLLWQSDCAGRRVKGVTSNSSDQKFLAERDLFFMACRNRRLLDDIQLSTTEKNHNR